MFETPPLTHAEVQAGARPGETWEQARNRLEAARWVYTVACKHCGFPNEHLGGEVPGPMCEGCTAEFGEWPIRPWGGDEPQEEE